MSLVTGGSALFTIISAFGFETADQSRVAAQIVTGVGFLGAGTVLRSGTSTSGLTAAATIWELDREDAARPTAEQAAAYKESSKDAH